MTVPRVPSLVLAFLFPLVLYARTSGFDYVHADDFDLIARNQAFLRDMGNVPRAFARSYFETESDLTGLETYYRPVTIVSFMVDTQRGGADPRAYHTTNIVLHATACVLLMLLAVTYGASAGAALAAALIFAAQPINVQTVAWIAGRNELLVGVFGLLALIAWARASVSPRSGADWIAAHVVTFALALFSKEIGLFFPALAVVHQWIVRRARLSRAQWVALVVDGIIVLVWMRLRVEALAGSPVVTLREMISVATSNSPQVLVQTGKLFVPVRLNVSPGVDSTGLVLGAIALVAIVWVDIRVIQRRHAVVGACWLVAFVAPPLIVPGLPAYEHRNYLPLVGILLALSTGARSRDAQRSDRTRRAPEAPKRRPPEATFPRRTVTRGAVLCLVVVTWALLTYGRQEAYRDAFAYWTDATHDAEFAPFAHVNLGQLHEGAGRLGDARREYQRALEIDPQTPKAHNNLGVISMKVNEPEMAVWYFNEEVRRHPSNAEAWFNLGLSAERIGNAIEARRHYERAIRENRMFLPAYERLGVMPPMK